MNENPFYDCEWIRLKQTRAGQNKTDQTSIEKTNID